MRWWWHCADFLALQDYQVSSFWVPNSFCPWTIAHVNSLAIVVNLSMIYLEIRRKTSEFLANSVSLEHARPIVSWESKNMHRCGLILQVKDDQLVVKGYLFTLSQGWIQKWATVKSLLKAPDAPCQQFPRPQAYTTIKLLTASHTGRDWRQGWNGMTVHLPAGDTRQYRQSHKIKPVKFAVIKMMHNAQLVRAAFSWIRWEQALPGSWLSVQNRKIWVQLVICVFYMSDLAQHVEIHLRSACSNPSTRPAAQWLSNSSPASHCVTLHKNTI